MKLYWTETAKNDLQQIYLYISRDSIEYADLLISEIYSKAEMLEKFPKMGRMVPEFECEELRELIYHNYRIVYNLKT